MYFSGATVVWAALPYYLLSLILEGIRAHTFRDPPLTEVPTLVEGAIFNLANSHYNFLDSLRFLHLAKKCKFVF